LKDLEAKINQKLHKKDLREEKKQMKALTTTVKEVKPAKQTAVKPVAPVQQPVQQQVQQPPLALGRTSDIRQRSGFIINF
jgi:hypothetical protein